MQPPLQKALKFILITLSFLMIASQSYSESISLKLPKYEDASHLYYYDLIRQSLEQIGITATIINTTHNIPQKRAVFMLNKNKIDGLWLIQSKQRDNQYSSAAVGLTNGLIGKRVFFIPKGDQKKYSQVSSLEDFKQLNLSGAFGKNWFDVMIWKQNRLNCITIDGNWRTIYTRVARKVPGYDYFSRGINEIVLEAKAHPELEIEERLLFIYDRDFQLYLGQSASQYKDLLHKALMNAKKSGLMEKLIRKHWSEVYSKMNLDKRIKIRLELPDS